MSHEIDPIWILLFDALFLYKGDFGNGHTAKFDCRQALPGEPWRLKKDGRGESMAGVIKVSPGHVIRRERSLRFDSCMHGSRQKLKRGFVRNVTCR